MNKLFKTFKAEILALINGEVTGKLKGQTLCTIQEFYRLIRAVAYNKHFETISSDLFNLLEKNNIHLVKKGIGFALNYNNL